LNSSIELYAFMEQESLLRKLDAKEQIRLSSFKRIHRFQVILGAIIVFVSGILGYYALQARNFMATTSWAVFVILICTVWYLVSRRLHTASIQGSMLILNNLSKRSSITPVSNVRDVKSRWIFGVQFTKLVYSLDGQSHSSIIVGNGPNSMQTVADCITVVKQWSKKKTNHKPGSVATQTA